MLASIAEDYRPMARPRTSTRICVESCLRLWLMRLPQGSHTLTWPDGICLRYERTPRAVMIPAQTIASYWPIDGQYIHLQNTTQPDNDAIQQWFRCACGQRVAKLYLPPNATTFLCRCCHNLIYHSSKTHDARLSHLARHPAELLKALSSPKPARRLLALKAALRYAL